MFGYTMVNKILTSRLKPVEKHDFWFKNLLIVYCKLVNLHIFHGILKHVKTSCRAYSVNAALGLGPIN